MPESSQHKGLGKAREMSQRIGRALSVTPMDEWLPESELLRQAAGVIDGLVEQLQSAQRDIETLRKAHLNLSSVERERDELENHRRDNEACIGHQQDKITGLLEQLQTVRSETKDIEAELWDCEEERKRLSEQLETERGGSWWYGEYEGLRQEHERLKEQYGTLREAVVAAIEMGLDHPDALETLHAPLRPSNPAREPDDG